MSRQALRQFASMQAAVNPRHEEETLLRELAAGATLSVLDTGPVPVAPCDTDDELVYFAWRCAVDVALHAEWVYSVSGEAWPAV